MVMFSSLVMMGLNSIDLSAKCVLSDNITDWTNVVIEYEPVWKSMKVLYKILNIHNLLKSDVFSIAKEQSSGYFRLRQWLFPLSYHK